MIGIFDSGVGGMTVAKAVEQLLPEHPLLYLGDIARTPYGPKSAKTIEEYSIENTRFLIRNGAKIIVIACNSASSVATGRLRREFNLPIFEVITPAVNAAVKQSATGRIGVIGTRATIDSGLYEKLIHQHNAKFKVVSKACPLLVSLVEEGWLNKRETKMILRRYLSYFKDFQIDTLVLGCTHYPLLSQLIQHRVGRRVQLIDSSQATAQYLKQCLVDSTISTPIPGHTARENKYYVTDLTKTAEGVAQTIFQRPIELLRA
ncbi:glutamate racemase [Desulforhopalus sp. IMCC35007]|uniref:glutamate racemase n=1 Tax=Desulforhopalus sp. IMCC35007 TaxID=2569543 RepID=UPI0010AE2DF4|nr:glutamate racemase [Desulforhopalus sp. IMCC35007]TKB06712.1 glutamate racemase [Desulforhopalus sp. IMCC35007]